jgi:hypothetical protein
MSGPVAAANRSVTLTGSALTLPVVYFNNQAAPPGVVAVTFRVNMGVQASIGILIRTAHTVEARGAFDNWGARNHTVAQRDGHKHFCRDGERDRAQPGW